MNKYEPLSQSEFTELQNHLEGIKSFLPSHLMNLFWSFYNRIRGVREKQPCSCPSSAKHWGNCVEELRRFVKERE